MEISVEERSSADKPLRLGSSAFAAFLSTDYGSQLYSDNTLEALTGDTNVPDKMVIPTSFHKRLKIVRYFYELDPIANTVIDKVIDIGITELILDRNDCTNEEFEVYESLIPVFSKYLREAGLEYLLSGLVVPRTRWESFSPSEVGVTNGNKRYVLPVDMWVLDPEYIELKRLPLTSKINVILKIPPEVKSFIRKNGKYDNGLQDAETLKLLRSQYPEILRAMDKSEGGVVLEDQYVLTRRSKTFDVYPTPFLLAALESLIFKRNLKKMDYSIASRVIGAIQLIKLGNDEYPLTEDDEDQLTDLEGKMLWRNRSQNVDRVFQLFANHTLGIEWVYPDTEAMLNAEKYEIVNQDIFYALGFPRILLSGETLRSATSQAEFAMFSPAESIRRLREAILDWLKNTIEEVKGRNGLEHVVTPKFEELRLYDLAKLSDVIAALYDSNAISLTSLAKSMGFDFEDELVMKVRERELMEKYDIPEFPAKPFSPQPSVPGGGKDARTLPENTQ